MLFYLSVTTMIYFDTQIVSDLSRGSPFNLISGSFCHFIIQEHFLTFSYKNIFKSYLVMFLESAISPRKPVSFNEGWYLETKVQVQCHLLLTFCFTQAFFVAKEREYMQIFISVFLCIYLCMYLSISFILKATSSNIYL